MPNALLRLDLWLSAFAVDLKEITNIIQSDIGLTAQVLRLAACEIEESRGKFVPITEIVVLVGVEKLKELVAHTKSVFDCEKGHSPLRACARFWTHSRLTALIAEELAHQSSEVGRDEACLAGLLCHLGDLSLLLGWDATPPDRANSSYIGSRIAEAWGFPRDLVDVIGGDREACRTRKSRTLLDIVEDADVWASRLEFLAARESKSVRAKSPPYRVGRG
jgi:HD-like signal output (HDOD) protein